MANESFIKQLQALSPEERAEAVKILGGTPAQAKEEAKYKQGGDYFTTVSRYVDGKYIIADPDHPQRVTVPEEYRVKLGADGNPEDRTLSFAKPEGPDKTDLIPPYAKIRRGPPGKRRATVKADERPSDTDPGNDQ